MIDEPSNTSGQYPSQEKLILQSYPTEPGPTPYAPQTIVAGGQPMQPGEFGPMPYAPQTIVAGGRLMQPGQLMQRSSPPLSHNPFARIRYFWHRDPAYKVLMVAIVMMIISGIILFTLITDSFAQSSQASIQGQQSQNQTQKAPVAPTATATVQPTPSPTVQSTVSASTSATPSTVGTTNQPVITIGGPLQLQIINIPQQVNNNSTVPVSVTTSRVGLQVRLEVTYNTGAAQYISRIKTTDQNGNVTLSWRVRLQRFANGNQTSIAQVTASGDENGQIVSSQTISVQVNG